MINISSSSSFVSSSSPSSVSTIIAAVVLRTKTTSLVQRQRRIHWINSCCYHTDENNNDTHHHQQHHQQYQYDMKYVNTIYAPSDFDVSSAVVYPNVITNDESNIIIKELISLLKRRRYEKGHWDSVIIKYKEIELIQQQHNNVNTTNEILHDIIYRIRNDILIPNHTNDNNSNSTTNWLPCHVIDLHVDGELNAHVDSIRYSGNIIAGLSFQCHSIMRLRPSIQESQDQQQDQDQEQHDQQQQYGQLIQDHNHNNNNQHYIDLLLPINSLYVLSGMSRYNYTHEILSANDSYQSPMITSSTANDMKFRNTNRISIIFRDAKQED